MNKKKISKDITWYQSKVTRKDREALNNHKGLIIWFTGLSGSGKSTLSSALEEFLFHANCRTFLLDGDNVRHGLCNDLGFSSEDRIENMRRVGEVAKLFMNAGVIVMAAFISPFRQDRDWIRDIVDEGDFIEIHCSCPLEICESRDTKGLYSRARKGEIKEFTGISSPYEPPLSCELIVDTANSKLEDCVNQIISYMVQKGYLTNIKI